MDLDPLLPSSRAPSLGGSTWYLRWGTGFVACFSVGFFLTPPVRDPSGFVAEQNELNAHNLSLNQNLLALQPDTTTTSPSPSATPQTFLRYVTGLQPPISTRHQSETEKQTNMLQFSPLVNFVSKLPRVTSEFLHGTIFGIVSDSWGTAPWPSFRQESRPRRRVASTVSLNGTQKPPSHQGSPATLCMQPHEPISDDSCGFSICAACTLDLGLPICRSFGENAASRVTAIEFLCHAIQNFTTSSGFPLALDSKRGAARCGSKDQSSMVGTWSLHLHLHPHHTFTILYLCIMILIMYMIDHGHMLLMTCYLPYMCMGYMWAGVGGLNPPGGPQWRRFSCAPSHHLGFLHGSLSRRWGVLGVQHIFLFLQQTCITISTMPIIILYLVYVWWDYTFRCVRIAGEKYYRFRCAFTFRASLTSMLLIMLLMLPTITAPPARTLRSSDGGGSSSTPRPSDMHPNIGKDWDFLPGVKRWNGEPFYEFLTVWFVALGVALASIVQDGNTLLQCAEEQDEGRGAGDDEDLKRKHRLRSARVYACILNYISPTSWITRHANKIFPNNGPGLYKFIKHVGALSYDEYKIEEMRATWDEATMSKIGIRFDPTAIWKWHDWIEDYGDKLGKTNSQKRKKFLEGFPEAFDIVIQAEKMKTAATTDLKIPANYPAWHPKSGDAHPQAGTPDVFAMAQHFYPEWSRRCAKGLIRQVPRGSVYQAEVNSDASDERCHETIDDDDDEDAYSVARSKITAAWVCVVCGGRGHASNVDGTDCLTKQLGITIPRSELASTRYPSGVRSPFTSDRRTYDRRSPSKSGESSHMARSARSPRPSPRPSPSRNTRDSRRQTPNRPRDDKRRSKPVRHAESMEERSEPEPTYDDQTSDYSVSDEHDTARLAVNFHTIDTRDPRSPRERESHSPSSDDPSSSRRRSATTFKAKRR